MISMPKSYWKQAPKGFLKWEEEDQREWFECFKQMQRERARKRYQERKDDPDFMEKQREYKRRYRKQNREKINAYQEGYRTKKWVEVLQAKADAQSES